MNKGRIIFDGEVEAAITEYMGAAMLSECNVDLLGFDRSSAFCNTSVMMSKLCVDSVSSVFEIGGAIEAKLSVLADRDYSNVRLEVPLRTVSGTSVTRFISEKLFELKGNSETVITMIIDISQLAPGKYTLNPVLREINTWGTSQNLDGIVDAFCFEIVPYENFNNGTIWDSYYSGYFLAPPIKIQVEY